MWWIIETVNSVSDQTLPPVPAMANPNTISQPGASIRLCDFLRKAIHAPDLKSIKSEYGSLRSVAGFTKKYKGSWMDFRLWWPRGVISLCSVYSPIGQKSDSSLNYESRCGACGGRVQISLGTIDHLIASVFGIRRKYFEESGSFQKVNRSQIKTFFGLLRLIGKRRIGAYRCDHCKRSRASILERHKNLSEALKECERSMAKLTPSDRYLEEVRSRPIKSNINALSMMATAETLSTHYETRQIET